MGRNRPHPRGGFTLVEILIVVTIMAILAGAIIPQFSNSTNDAKKSAAAYDLSYMRSQIQTYRAQHGGLLPSQSLVELISQTNSSGAIGSGTSYPYGPYAPTIPVNPYNGINTVVAPGSIPPTATVSGAGWLYDTASGSLWLNDTTTPFASQ
ncbi:MAG TPA: type II secretion system protein [Pirellulales bacterium]|jgi:general secretion pathway protein G|nr:type II secretion system protein [Pirellulales bacterium]